MLRLVGMRASVAVVSVLALGAAAWLGLRGERAPARPNVILIVVDTLRSDRLGCYGYGRPISPEIDALAAEGVLFTECVAQAPWTLPSMTSMLSGRYLFRDREWPEAQDVLLAETFQRAGYATIGLSANVLLAEDHDFHRGYDHYDASAGPPDNDGKPFAWLYEALWPPVEAALAGNEGGKDQPLFLFLQPFDPHFSYQPHTEYDAALPPAGAEPVLPATWHSETLARAGVEAPGDDPGWQRQLAGLQHLRGLYEQEVRYADHWVGKVLERLRALKVLDHAVVALVSDHGEGLWEHLNYLSVERGREHLGTKGPDGYFFHSHARHVYEEAIRTPLILWGEGVPEGQRVDLPVENVDVYATLCALAGVEAPRTKHGRPQLEGLDLSAAWRTGASGAPGALAAREHTFSYTKHVATVRERSTGLKLVLPTCGFADAAQWGIPRELFHLPSDPHERTNLHDQRPADVERLTLVLQRAIEAHPAEPTTDKKSAADVRRQLAGGYDPAVGPPVRPDVRCD